MVVVYGILNKIVWPMTGLVRNQAEWLNSTDFNFNLNPTPAGDTIDSQDKDVLNGLNNGSFVVQFNPIPVQVIQIVLYAGMPPILKD